MKITYEKRNKRVSAVKSTIERIVNRNGQNKQSCVNELSEIMGECWGIKIGFGGSHVWVSNQKNERLILIEGY